MEAVCSSAAWVASRPSQSVEAIVPHHQCTTKIGFSSRFLRSPFPSQKPPPASSPPTVASPASPTSSPPSAHSIPLPLTHLPCPSRRLPRPPLRPPRPTPTSLASAPAPRGPRPPPMPPRPPLAAPPSPAAYGVILIPEGLIDFIPEVRKLIAELNEILVHDVVDEAVVWKNKLELESKQLFDFLPPSIQEQLLLERDPHGNVQVAKIETEKMLITMVEMELEKRKAEGKYKGHFIGQSHFFGYEGRCGLPTNFDASYCYALGYGAGALLQSGKTGLISPVGNLAAPVTEWTVGGTALTSLMDVERRHALILMVDRRQRTLSRMLSRSCML